MVLSFYVEIQGTLSNWTNYKLFTLEKPSCFDIKGTAVSQTDGKGHVVEIGNGVKDVYLSVKGEGFVTPDYLWGTLTIPTFTK